MWNSQLGTKNLIMDLLNVSIKFDTVTDGTLCNFCSITIATVKYSRKM